MKPSAVVSVSAIVGVALSVPGPGRASTEVGSCMPSFELVNYQTKSPTYEQLVSSSSYADRAAVFMLLSSG